MDDFNISSLHESKNEWSSRLVTVLTPLFIEGYRSILEESVKMCKANDEMSKYLMTFQNLISRIPKWNQTIVENECIRIIERSGCVYLEDLITCVHVIQLKILTSVRVGQHQKKIDITIPKLNDFIHKAYINVGRKIYKNVYLYELNVPPLQAQKNNREIEIIIQECILNTIRESIPVESILLAYMNETIEENVTEDITEEIIYDKIQVPDNDIPLIPEKKIIEDNTYTSNIKFNDVDYMKDDQNVISAVDAPKTIERLDELSSLRNHKQALSDDDDTDDENDKLTISNVDLSLDTLELNDIDEKLELKIPDLIHAEHLS